MKRHKPHATQPMATPTAHLLAGSCNVVAAVAVAAAAAAAAAAVVAVVVGGRTLLYFERRRNQAKLSVWPPLLLLLLLLLLRSLFPFFRFFICHNSSSSSRQRRPKKGSSFSTRCTFHGEHRRRFHYISFHSFIPLAAARCWLLVARCLHSFRTRRFNSTFDSVSLYLQVAVRL